jgi:toxin HigB-1
MIKTFQSKALAAFYANARDTRRLPVQNTARVARILTALDAATVARDMDIPGFRFHSLAPGQPGRFSVWVSGNYRITFSWDGGPADVDIEDYH